ncbi:MAG TPA: hypothetical protein VHE14_09045 [Solirubrobacteraceae bacterium]|nr:hypothetical protein [Solirubrobacteraceae bacterium]
MSLAAILAVLAAAVGAAFALARVLRRRPVATAVIVDPAKGTVIDDSGAFRSVQAADLTLPEEELERIWNPEHLERLARTYWRFLSRVTLGLVHVSYGESERCIVFLRRPLVLLRFKAPEYELDDDRGLVRWRIEDGVLVSRRGKGGDGYLEIEVRRRPSPQPGYAVAHVKIEVANFYPAIAAGFSRPVYKATQSTLHVLVTHSFLRSLARLDLARSRVGRLASSDPPAGDGGSPPAEARRQVGSR